MYSTASSWRTFKDIAQTGARILHFRHPFEVERGGEREEAHENMFS